ncbi:hypothetical protein ULMS_16770 [Patiriisocius marinistellae]|uniref:Type VI secretion, VasB, ImpH, VC_A0111 n=1 Tax=Patiriisocius marinistellae TaxID=2494560 RepID=A0A5J4G0V1_9FLAO|nr:hypothetical protein [Patiriisocius marinistellae]GEQ86169.1 hypothetical protein ULMS_16770 [Patiriisocius marinistellae]
MEKSTFEAISEELNTLYENIKAEVIVGELEKNSEAIATDFIIQNKSTFSRPYRRDILNIDSLINTEKITLNLSRNGIYDTLPEGFFHKPQAKQDAEDYLAKRKQFQEQEQEARTFFSPIENEFFYQKFQIEKKERELLNDFYNLNDNFLIEFWDLDTSIPSEYRLKLIKLLPYNYKIAGNFELTRRCLEEILNVPVLFKEMYSNSQEKKKNNSRSNQLILGVDTILDSENNAIFYPELNVTIGSIPTDKIDDFISKDGVRKFIILFFEYFIPIEIQVIIKFTVNNEEGFLLNKENAPIMGISTQI